MSSKIGVYFDAVNIGGGLDVEALAAGVKGKWDSLVAVTRVFPVLAEQTAVISKDIEENGLDGVLICGASPRQDSELYRFPVLTERVNLREQCVMSYEDPSGNPPVEGAPAPELLTEVATDYINMGVVKLQKGSLPDSAALEKGVHRILVVGGGFTGLTAALEAAQSGYEVVLVEKAERLGGAVNNIPTGSPLHAPWEAKESTGLPEKIAAVEANPLITVYLSSTVGKLAGQPGAYTLTVNTPAGEKTMEVGSAVVAAGWTPLAPKYLESMGYGSPMVMHAAEFGKAFLAGQITARRIAFVLDTTLAEEAARMNYDNIIPGADNWNPRQFFEPIAAPENVRKNKDILSWEACDYAICYLVLQNDSVVDITTQCQSVVDASAKSDSFTVKAVNEYGSLGPSSTAQDGTSGSNTLADDNHRPDMVAIGGNGYIEILVQSPLPVSIHNVSGQQVKEGTYQPGVHFITSLPAGFYLVNGQKVIVK